MYPIADGIRQAKFLQVTFVSDSNSIYDYPKYYDLIYGSDWKAEFDFLHDCFEKYSRRLVTYVFEPACGTGRLLFRFGRAGYRISGLDLNEKSIEFCNQRFEKYEITDTAFVADMSEFQLDAPCEAAFNMINSFRHLTDHQQSVRHFECMRDSMADGAIYILGLHLSPLKGETIDRESWSASRGHLTINSSLWLVDRNLGERYEDYGMSYDVYTPTNRQRLENTVRFRTYTADQFTDLIAGIDGLEIVGIHDFSYDIDLNLELDETVEDAVFVIQKTGSPDNA